MVGLPSDVGQLLQAERIALYDEVKAAKPSLVFEVGTWRGGGSTYQMSTALMELGGGQLLSCEVDRAHHDHARALYSSLPQGRFVKLLLSTSHAAIAMMAEQGLTPDFLFFDGPEEPDVALNDLVALEPRLRRGARFSMHDWEPGASIKQQRIRPYIESSSRWRIYRRLMPPESVGLVFAEFLGQ